MANKNKVLVFLFSVVFSLWLPSFSYAELSSGKTENIKTNTQSVNSEEGQLVTCSLSECTSCHLLKLAERIFFWLLAAAASLAALLIVISGYFYLFSTGNSDHVEWAKDALRYALTGFGLCLLSWLIVHAVYSILGYKGNWWQMECANLAKGASDNQINLISEVFANEVTANNQGGRNNPVALPDIATAGIKNLPENKYFFLHGLGGQPLDNAAKQLAQVAEEARKEGKILFVITPVKNPDTLEIEGSKPINLNKQIGTNFRQTQKNIRTVLAGLMADSPTGTNFPFFIASSEDSLTGFNNIWPSSVDFKNSLKTYRNGVVYAEGETVNKGEEETLFSVNLISDLSTRQAGSSKDPKNEKFYLNRDNPITFNLPEDISPAAAKQMAVDIAQVVAESTKNSQALNKDQWNQLVGLMSKDVLAKKANYSPANINVNDDSDNVYNPAVFASYAVKNPGQKTDPVKLREVEKELDKIAKDLIDKEIPRNTNNNANQNDNKKSSDQDRTGGLFESIQNYFLYHFSDTPALDNWMAEEKKTPHEGNNGNIVNVNRVPNLDPAKLSKIGGRITTDNILSLEQREAIKSLIIDIQKEMKDNSGIDYNIPPDLIMCVFQKETKFDPGAMSQTGCSGLGQLNMGAARTATIKLKKLAPKHFKALSDKARKDFGVDMEEALTREGGNDKKREILRSDPNLNAALAYVHLTDKGIARRGGAARGEQDWRTMVNGYGPGNYSYASSILDCLKNKSWMTIPDKIQAIINTRETKNKDLNNP